MPAVLAGFPVNPESYPRDFPVFKPHKGSRIVPCKLCSDDCWIGPEQYKKMRAEDAWLVCVPCIALKLGWVDVPVVALSDKKAGA